MASVSLGLIGAGGMGSYHARYILNGDVRRLRLAAVSDAAPEQLEAYKDDIPVFADSHELIRSGLVDAVLIATPHYAHTTIGIDALQQGLHVLVEKPISVHKADCERLIAAHRKRKQVFAAMLSCRTDPLYKKIKKAIDEGQLGRLTRVNWIITNWFRTEAYYASGTWRATWAGEGGGVLLNQCLHQLDLLQWLCSMPARVRAVCGLGKYHDIEVEDEVTAYMEYRNGATGVFITSTGEAPGTDRLEIVGENGKLVTEDRKLLFTRNKVSALRFCRESEEPFGLPDARTVEIPVRGKASLHVGIMRNFVAAILDGKPLIAPAREGIHSVELVNAMLLSSLTRKTVDLPLDAKAYERRLKRLIRESKPKKKPPRGTKPANMASSFR